jgi:hypothetical protein
MAGINDESGRLGPINPASLVTPASPVVTPSSVAALSDAFRNGIITADDILNRAGELGRAKRKAEIAVAGAQGQVATEAVSPEAIAGRSAELAAHTQLAQETASPEAVQARRTALTAASANAELQQASATHGPEAIQAFFKYAPLVQGYDGPPKRADGSLDWDLIGKEGANLDRQATVKAQASLRGAEAKRLSEKDETTGATYERIFNALGEDITNPDVRAAHTRAATAPFSFLSIKPGAVAPSAPSAPAASAPAPTAPAPAPASPPQTLYGTDAQAAADAAERAAQGQGQPQIAPSPAVTPMASATPAQPAVAPRAPVPAQKPEISLAPPHAVGEFVPGRGIVTGAGPTMASKGASELRGEIARNPVIQEVQKALPQYGQLQQSERELSNPNFQPDRIFDLRLAFNYFKSLHPETRVTEQNFKELEKFTKIYANDIPQTLKNSFNVLTRQQYLDPMARQAVLRETRAALQGQVDAARPVLESYATLADQSGIPREAVLTKEWQDLLNTQMVKPGQPGQPAASNNTPVMQIQGIGGIQKVNGRYIRVN